MLETNCLELESRPAPTGWIAAGGEAAVRRTVAPGTSKGWNNWYKILTINDLWRNLADCKPRRHETAGAPALWPMSDLQEVGIPGMRWDGTSPGLEGVR